MAVVVVVVVTVVIVIVFGIEVTIYCCYTISGGHFKCPGHVYDSYIQR